MWVNITFLISPLCRVQTFQTPCICLRSHISPGFLWPGSSLQLFPKKVFQVKCGHQHQLDKASATPLCPGKGSQPAFPLFETLASNRYLLLLVFFFKRTAVQQLLNNFSFKRGNWVSSVFWAGEFCLWTTDYLLRTTDSWQWRHHQ